MSSHAPAARKGSNGMSRYFVHYKDDGPSGPCGQSMSVTAPWSRLYVYEGPTAEADACALLRHIEAWGRINPRVVAIWSDEDGNALSGPVVPDDLRLPPSSEAQR